MAHDETSHRNNGAGYEVEDASPREIVLSAIGLAVGTIIICFAVLGLFRVLRSAEANDRPQQVTEVAAPQSYPPGPKLQDKPWEELMALRQKEDQTLTTYGWVNKGAGTVRIPIDRAMDIVAQRGFAVRAGSAQGSSMSTAGTGKATQGGITSLER